MGSFDSKIDSKCEKEVKIVLPSNSGAKDTIQRPFQASQGISGARETFQTKNSSFRSTQSYDKVSHIGYLSNKGFRKTTKTFRSS